MRRASLSLAIGVTMVVVLAGCFGAPTKDEEPIEDPPRTYIVDQNGVTHHANGVVAATQMQAQGGMYTIGFDAVEPTIGIDPDGVLWMTAIRGETNDPTVVASEDGGLTWEERFAIIPVVDRSRHLVTTDPYIHVDPMTGRVYTADLIHNCAALSWTDDAGESWTTNPEGCGQPGILDHQTYVTSKSRGTPTTPLYPRLLHICANEITHADCATSLDGGLTFGPQHPVFTTGQSPDGFPCSALTGHLAADAEGRLFLPTTACSTYPSAPMVYVSEDDGITWTGRVINADPKIVSHTHDVAIATDEANNVFAAWVDWNGHLHMAYSRDHGATWSPALNLTGPGVTATWFHDISAGSEGRIAFAYVGTTAPGGYVEKGVDGSAEVEDPATTTWNAYVGFIEDAFAAEPLIHTVAANPLDEPVAEGECGRTRCGGMTDFIGLEISPEGRPYASMVDTCTPKCDAPNVGFVATLREGPSLRVVGTALTPLPAQN